MRQSTIPSFSILVITGILSCCFIKTARGALNDSSVSGSTIYAGTAVDKPYLFSNQKYINIVNKYFQFITPGNAMKWDATEKAPGVFTFTDADAIVNFAKTNSKFVRGHAAVWHQQVPDWLKQLDAQALTKATQTHIKTVLQHYKDILYSFDVCNEVVGDDGKLRDSFWSQKLNDSFIEMAFQAAKDAGTHIKLYINDYNVEAPGKKSDMYYEIVKKLAKKKIINGVGFQGHLIVNQVPPLESLKANLKRFVDLGLEVAYTEVDIRMPLPASQKDIIQQAKDFTTMARACHEVVGCVGITAWGVGERDSWIPGQYPKFGNALLFDENYEPKPALESFEKALSGIYTQ